MSTINKRGLRAGRGRRWLLVGTAAALAFTLAGCGSSDSSDDDAKDAGNGYPLTVETSQGDVTIPHQPERVVALSIPNADELLSLGVEPAKVAVVSGELDSYPWLEDKLTDVADSAMLQTNYELNLEAIATSKPDLIIAQTWQVADKAVFDQLNSIAPTVTPVSKATNVDWDERLLKTAEAVGETKKAEALISDIRAEFAAVGEKDPEISSKTYQWVRANPDDFGFGNGSVLELLGLKPAENQDNTQNSPPLSKEKTSDLDADLLAIFVATDDLRKGLDDDPLFQALPSVKNKTVLYAELDFANAANSPAPLALRWLEDKLTPYVETLAG